MSEVTLSVKVQGLEQLRETVALLKELKELGAGNHDINVEMHTDTVTSEQPWLPDDLGGWIEHSGGGMPVGVSEYVNVLTTAEREKKSYTTARCNSYAWRRQFHWYNPDDRNNIVAYRNLPE